MLTNLQRGNIQTETVILDPVQLSFHQRAGKGEITSADLESGILTHIIIALKTKIKISIQYMKA